MSLEGKAAANAVLRGRINGLDTLTMSAYAIAVKNGFEGTEEEWLASLKGEPGDKGDSCKVTATETEDGVLLKIYNTPSGGGATYTPVLIKHGEKGDPGAVQTVNGIAPDENGNVEVAGGGLSTAQITALDNMFKVCAFTKEDVSAEYAAFKAAFGITDPGGDEEPDEPVTPDEPDEPDTPAVTLSSISAVYSGGDVAVGTVVTELTGIVVTAHYSDGTSAAVSGYTLSGTIAEGENTVTVTYEGMTTTFTVNGFVETTTPLGVAWTEGVYTTQGSVKTGAGWEKYVSSDFVPLSGYNSICIGNETGVNALWSIQVNFYDSEKTYVSAGSGYVSDGNASYPSPLVFQVPENAEYVVLSTTISNGKDTKLRYYTDLDWYLE